MMEGNRKKWIEAGALSLLGTLCLPAITRSQDALTMGNSVLSFFFFLMLTGVIRRARQERYKSKLETVLCLLFSFCFSAGMAFGRGLTFGGYVKFTDPVMWLSILILAAVFTFPVRYAWHGIDRLAALKEGRARQTGTGRNEDGIFQITGRLKHRARFFLTAAAFFVCWIPVLLAVWPGFFVYDATDEVRQVLEWSFNDRHPLLHVLLLGKTVSAGFDLTGSYNTGIVWYMLLQMLLCALCFTWLLGVIKKSGAPRWVRGVCFLFLAFFPVIQMYVLCSSKDTLYTLSMLAVMGLLVELTRDAGAFFGSFRKPVFLGAALYGMSVFRNNGFYVFLCMIPVLLIVSRRGNRRRMAAVAGLTLLCVLGTNGLLRAALKPVSTGAMEMLTVPIQQLTRAYMQNREVFGPAEVQTLLEVLPEEAMNRYRPELSDPVKIDFRGDVFSENPGRYISLWAKIGLRCPFTYLNAWLSTSYGFWYPDVLVNVYRGNATHTVVYEDSSYFGFETEEPGVRESRLPLLEKVYRKLSLEIFQQKIPVISMLFSPGFLFWIYAFVFLYLLRGNRAGTAAVLLPAAGNWLTVLPGPTYLVRYVLIFWFALPLLPVVIHGNLCYTANDNERKA